ncbi:glycosyltransferase family 4 protein [Cohnella faecalis]|nr:glycosyltransferase family 4 protein [Cohnella faecalis]
MLKVAFVTPGAYAVPSAMGGSVERVVEKVVPLLVPRVDARIYGRTARRLPKQERWRGVRCERFPAASKSAYFRRVCRRLRAFRPHIIQVENRPLWVPKLKRLFPDSRIWLNLHSTTFISRPYLSAEARSRCLSSADRIVVNSHFLKDVISGLVPRTAARIRVNHLGVDLERFSERSEPEDDEQRSSDLRKGRWNNRKVVLYVGRLVPQKGVHHLLGAMKDIVREHPDVLVVIVGGARYGSKRGSAYVEKLKRMARPWEKHVHFEPYAPHDQIHRWYEKADVAVVPSVGKEAFGLVNVEAMASRLPVVATAAGGIKEVVADGETGFLISARKEEIRKQLADKVDGLLKDEELRIKMGKCGRERVERLFTWQRTSDRWIELAKEGMHDR